MDEHPLGYDPAQARRRLPTMDSGIGDQLKDLFDEVAALEEAIAYFEGIGWAHIRATLSNRREVLLAQMAATDSVMAVGVLNGRIAEIGDLLALESGWRARLIDARTELEELEQLQSETSGHPA